MPEQKIILSVISQALDGMDEKGLLHYIRIVNTELRDILDKFDEVEYAPDIPNETPVIEIGNHRIEAVTFTD